MPRLPRQNTDQDHGLGGASHAVGLFAVGDLQRHGGRVMDLLGEAVLSKRRRGNDAGGRRRRCNSSLDARWAPNPLNAMRSGVTQQGSGWGSTGPCILPLLLAPSQVCTPMSQPWDRGKTRTQIRRRPNKSTHKPHVWPGRSGNVAQTSCETEKLVLSSFLETFSALMSLLQET